MPVSINGTSGLTFNDSTTQGTAPVGVGIGQTWQNVTASRASGTTYTNTTGKPIMIAVTVNRNGGFTFIVGGVTVLSVGANNITDYLTLGPVPAGATYSITAGSGIGSWAELR